MNTSTLSPQDIENTNRSLNFLNPTSNTNSEENIGLHNTTSIVEDVKKEKGKEKEVGEKVDEIGNTDNENISEVSELESLLSSQSSSSSSSSSSGSNNINRGLENLKSYFNLENSELADLSNPSSPVISELHQNLENLERQFKETNAELASLIIDQSDNIRRYDELTEVRNSLTSTFLQVHAHFAQKLALLKVIVSANPFAFAGSTLLLGGALLGGAYLAYRSSSSSSLSSSSGTNTGTGGGIITVTEILNRPGPISFNLPNYAHYSTNGRWISYW